MLHRQSELKALSLRQTLTHFGRDVNSSKIVNATTLTGRPNARISDQLADEIAHFALSEDRIAQLVLEMIKTPYVAEVAKHAMTSTERGAGGFGSTG